MADDVTDDAADGVADGPSRRTSALPLLGAVAVVGALLGGLLLLDRGPQPPPPPARGYALDLQDPWPLRGTPALVAGDALAGLPPDWAGTTPLFAQRRSGRLEVVLLDADDRRWAVARSLGTRAGTDWEVQPHDLPDVEVGLLAAAVDDPGGRRLLVVGAPTVEKYDRLRGQGLAYAQELEEPAPGVGQGPLDEDRGGTVVGRVGDEVVAQADVPDP